MVQVNKRRLMILKGVVVCTLLFALAAAAWGIEVEKEAGIFDKTIMAGEKLLLADVPEADKTEENAYKIQALLFKTILDRTSDTVAGYKAGLTAAPLIARFKALGPVWAPLLKSGLIEITDPKEKFILKRFPGMMLETEFVFKSAVPIESPVKDEETLKKLIQSVHTGVELPQVYFADMANLGFFDLTASGVGSKSFVVGPPHETGMDLDAMAVTLSRDGKTINEGKGADALGAQWKALLWLVNSVTGRGEKIAAGQYMMTGALGNMIPAEPGEYVLIYPFETLTFKVE